MGIPTVFVTALPTIAQMVGANRVLRGAAITHPTGEPSLAADDEPRSASGMLERALEMLATDVGRARSGRCRHEGGMRDRRRLPDAAACARPGPARVEARARAGAAPEILAALRSYERCRRLPAEPGVHRQRGARRPPRAGATVVARRAPGKPRARLGDIIEQAAIYELLAELDRFELVRMSEEPRPGELPLYPGDEIVGAFAPAHENDETLTATVLLENLACMAGAVQATRYLLADARHRPDLDPYVIGAGEEAMGDRYQRGGGNLGKAIAEATRAHRGERLRREGVLRRPDPRPDRRRRAGRLGRARAGGGRRGRRRWRSSA